MYKRIIFAVSLITVLILNSGCLSTPETKTNNTSSMTNATADSYISRTGIFYSYEPEKKLNESLNSGKPTLLDLSADWCPYCRQMVPVMTALRKEYDDRINFVGANIDVETRLADKYVLIGTPTYVFFDRNGSEVGFLVGPQSLEKMKMELDKLLQ